MCIHSKLKVEDETDIPIEFIRITDMNPVGNGARAYIVIGGPLYNHVAFELHSQRNGAIKSRVEIYEMQGVRKNVTHTLT